MLDIDARVYADNSDAEAPCMWFARCVKPANGLRNGPIAGTGGGFGDIPICKDHDDWCERMSS